MKKGFDMLAVKFESDEAFEAWIQEDVRDIAGGKPGNEAAALAEGERRDYDLEPIRAKYREAKATVEQKVIKPPSETLKDRRARLNALDLQRRASKQEPLEELAPEALFICPEPLSRVEAEPVELDSALIPKPRRPAKEQPVDLPTPKPKESREAILKALVPEQVEDEEEFVGVKSSKAVVKRQAFSMVDAPSGIPSTYINAKIALQNLKLECRYDIFHDRLTVAGFECSGNGDATENLDNVALKVRDTVIKVFKFDPGKNHLFDAIVSLALDHTYDPVKEYLEDLEWDGEPRLDRWLIDWCGVADTRLNREIGRKMLLAGVRRVVEPGVKFDYIVVLEGAQGSGRSSLLKILAGGDENYSDTEILRSNAKEMQEQIQGVWIYELAELVGIEKVSINKAKNFASQTVDRARPAYGRNRVDRRRRCIFVATTNDDTYLRDETGNRRFWPVKLPRGWLVDLEGFAEVRDQLWAEAVVLEAAVDFRGRKEPLVIAPELWDVVAVEQAKRLGADPWEEILSGLVVDGKAMAVVDGSQADGMGEPEWRVATADLLAVVLEIPKSRQYKTHMLRLAAVMRRLGWTKPDEPFKIKKKTTNGYRRQKG
jgi:putative DNA primase/helicase